MDKALVDDIAAAAAAARSGGEALDVTAEAGDRVLDLRRAARGDALTLVLSDPSAETVDPDLAWAWLEASWLRRTHDGVVAVADDDGRLGFAAILPLETVSAETAATVLASLERASHPDTADDGPAADDAVFNDGNIWLKL